MSDTPHSWQELFEELKRRRVIRVATLYVLIFWPIIQVVDIASAAIGLPDEAMRYLVFAFFGGMPVLLVLAWLYDLNRGGLVRDTGDDTGEALLGSKLELGIIGVMVFVVGGLFYVQFSMEEPEQVFVEEVPVLPELDPVSANSIAVLPFDTFSDDNRDRFFADGLSEELLNVLAGLSQLEVAARTSSFAYRGTRKLLPEIGQELGVRYVLEGSVRRNDVSDEIRVTAQLIEAKSGVHMWSETFDRPFSDVFAIQDEIAAAVVDALKVTLLGDEAEEIRSHASASPEAMIAYSMGQAELVKRTKVSMQDAERFFRRALEDDPNYSEAWVGLADANTLQVSYGYEDERTGLEEAREAVARALELSPDMGMAWASRGLIESQVKNMEEARSALEKAIELSPSYAMAHMWYAGMLDDANDRFKHYEIAYKLDPRSPVAGFNVASQYINRGREAEAMDVFGQIIEADPNFAMAYTLASRVSTNRGRYADAIRALETAYELDPAAETAYYLANLNNHLQNFGASDDWIERARPDEPPEMLFRYDVILYERYAMRGELDKALEIGKKLAYPESDHPTSRMVAATASYFIRDYENAVKYFESLSDEFKQQIDWGQSTDLTLAVGFSYRQIGNEEKAAEWLGKTRETVNRGLEGAGSNPYFWYRLAQLEAIEGNEQMALINLQRAANEGWREYWSPAIDPAFENLLESTNMQRMVAGLETRMDLMREEFEFERSFADIGSASDKGS